jgi:hypothetical protein
MSTYSIQNYYDLITYLSEDARVNGPVKQSLVADETLLTTYQSFINLLEQALKDAGESLPKELLKSIPLEDYVAIYPEVATNLSSWSLNANTDGEVNVDHKFWTNFVTNATDPFRGIQNYSKEFERRFKQAEDERNKVSADQKQNVDTTANRLKIAEYDQGYLNQGLTRAVEYGAQRLNRSIDNISNRLTQQTRHYQSPSGLVGRPSNLDIFAMFAGEENRNLGFRGYVYQMQNTSALAALVTRPGATVIGTQGYSAASDAQDDFTRASIYGGNDLAVRASQLYNGQADARIKPVYMNTGSIHAKLGYFYEGQGQQEQITKFFISTQNYTPALDQSTTIEEMLVINRAAFKLDDEEHNQWAVKQRASFDAVSKQIKAATDALLSLQDNKHDTGDRDPNNLRDRFKTLYENNLVATGAGHKALYVNEDIHEQMSDRLGRAAADGKDKAIMSVQYIEQMLDPNKNMSGTPFSVKASGFEALKTLAESGRLSIGITATSYKPDLGLFALLDNYYAVDKIAESSRTENQKERHGLIKTLLENNAFTLMPSQFMHSKSFAVLDENNKLKSYGIGSANLSKQAYENNIETMLFLDKTSANSLDLLSTEEQDDIANTYLHGYSRFGLNLRGGKDYQGLLVERRGNSAIAEQGLAYLQQMGGKEARVWESTDPSKMPKFIFSRRYLVGEGEAKLVGATIQIASPIQGQPGYSFDVTFGGEQTINSRYKDGMEPVVYLNKTQRMLAGMVYKNSSGDAKTYQVYDPREGKVVDKTLRHGDSYQAGAFDVLGGLVTTMYHSMQYEYQIRGVHTTFGNLDKGVFQTNLRKLIGANFAEIGKGLGYSLNKNKENIDLENVSKGLIEQLAGSSAKDRIKAKVAFKTQLTDMLGGALADYDQYVPGYSKTEALAGLRREQMTKAVDVFVEGLMSMVGSSTSGEAIHQQVAKFTSTITDRVIESVSMGLRTQGGLGYSGIYNDLIMQTINSNPVLAAIYKNEVEKGKKEAFSNQVDIFPQPHETNYSFGQGIHRLPVYGEDKQIANVFDYLRGGETTGFVMSPYALMHGEGLGAYSGEYLRAVASSGRLKFQDAYVRYGGLLKLEGGAPVVHNLMGLMQSMPGLSIIKKSEYIKETTALLEQAGRNKDEAKAEAERLAKITFSRYERDYQTSYDGRLLPKYDEQGNAIPNGQLDEEGNLDQLLYFFPFAKSEQISQRMKNLTSTRPIYEASKEFVQYALSFGSVGSYNAGDAPSSLGGSILGSLSRQQFDYLKDEYLREFKRLHPDNTAEDADLLRNPDPQLLRRVAVELSEDQKQIIKGFIGGKTPRRVVIGTGASQLSDYGLLNSKYNDLRYVQPHVVQATATLDSFSANPAALQKEINDKLKPGTIFLAKDLKVELTDVLNSLNKQVTTEVTSRLAELGVTPVGLADPKGKLNIGNFIESVRLAVGDSLDARDVHRLVIDSIQSLNSDNLRIDISRGSDEVGFYYRKGVYSPPDVQKDSDGKDVQLEPAQYLASMEKIGEVKENSMAFTIKNLFNYSSSTGDSQVRPMLFRLPAMAGRELGEGITVVSDSRVNVSRRNTVTLDLNTQTIKADRDAMRPGTTMSKGPMRTAEGALWEALAGFTEGTKHLLPTRVAAQDVFAMLSTSQIKGFNFDMGLGLLEEQQQSGIYELITGKGDSKVKGGRAIAEALAMLLMTFDDSTNIEGLKEALRTSLTTHDAENRSQYAEALRLRPVKSKANDSKLKSSLSFYSGLAALVGGVGEGETLESALTQQVISALTGDDDALNKLQSGTQQLFDTLFTEAKSLKTGQEHGKDIYTHLDDFTTRPAGLLAFLLKASQDIYRNVDVQDRLNAMGFSEVSLDSRSMFNAELDADADGYLKKLHETIRGSGDYKANLGATLRRHETTELIRELHKLAGTDLTEHNERLARQGPESVADYLRTLQDALNTPAEQRTNEQISRLAAQSQSIGLFNISPDDLTAVGEDHSIVRRTLDELAGQSSSQSFLANADEATIQLIAASVSGKLADVRSQQEKQIEALKTDIKRNLTDSGVSNADQQLQDLLTAYGKDDKGEDGEKRLLKYGEKTKLATYTALELYGKFGHLGEKLSVGIEEVARRFRYTLPDADKVKGVLNKLKQNQTITSEEEQMLHEVEAVYQAIRTYVQTQRFIELPGEYEPSKLAVPAGMKNITALEGHYAQGLTAKQLEMYAYNPKDLTDVGTIQHALVQLAIVYENVVPTHRQVQDSYGIMKHNLGDAAVVQHIAQTELGLTPQLITNATEHRAINSDLSALVFNEDITTKRLGLSLSLGQNTTYDFINTYLTHYTSFGRHQLPGNVDSSGRVETRTLGTKAVSEFIKQGHQKQDSNSYLPALQQMMDYADITRRNLGNNLDYEANINRRVDLVLEETRTRLDRKFRHKAANNPTFMAALETRLEEAKLGIAEFNMEEFLDRLYSRQESPINTSLNTTHLYDQDSEDILYQKEYLRNYNATGTRALATNAALNAITETYREQVRTRVENTFNMNTGAEYLEGMESLYQSAQQQFEYYRNKGDFEGRLQRESAKTIMQSLSTTRMISLPSIEILDRHSLDTQGRGLNVVTVGSDRNAQTGVLLGLDILQKLSLLFNAESHPALEAQFKLVAKLQRLQPVIDKIQLGALQGVGTSTITDEEVVELQELQVLMQQSKETAVELVHNKNSIRQATANRMGMSGTSYIAVNSFLVGMDEVGMGSRVERAAGLTAGNGIRRLSSSIDKSIRKDVKAIRLAAALGSKGQILMELTITNEIEYAQELLQELTDGTVKNEVESVIQKLRQAQISGDRDTIENALRSAKGLVEVRNTYLSGVVPLGTENPVKTQLAFIEEQKVNQQRIRNLDVSLGYIKGENTIIKQRDRLNFGVSGESLQNRQDEISRLEAKRSKQIAYHYNTRSGYVKNQMELQQRINEKNAAIAKKEAQVVDKQQKIAEQEAYIRTQQASLNYYRYYDIRNPYDQSGEGHNTRVQRARRNVDNKWNWLLNQASTYQNLNSRVLPAIGRKINTLTNQNQFGDTYHDKIVFSIENAIGLTDEVPPYSARDFIGQMRFLEKHLTRYNSVAQGSIIPSNMPSDLNQLSQQEQREFAAQVNDNVRALFEVVPASQATGRIAVNQLTPRGQSLLAAVDNMIPTLEGAYNEINNTRLPNILTNINAGLADLGVNQTVTPENVGALTRLDAVTERLMTQSDIKGYTNFLFNPSEQQLNTVRDSRFPMVRAAYLSRGEFGGFFGALMFGDADLDAQSIDGVKARQKAASVLFPIEQGDSLYAKLKRANQLQARARSNIMVADLGLRGPEAVPVGMPIPDNSFFYNEDGWPQYLTGQVENLTQKIGGMRDKVTELEGYQADNTTKLPGELAAIKTEIGKLDTKIAEKSAELPARQAAHAGLSEEHKAYQNVIESELKLQKYIGWGYVQYDSSSPQQQAANLAQMQEVIDYTNRLRAVAYGKEDGKNIDFIVDRLNEIKANLERRLAGGYTAEETFIQGTGLSNKLTQRQYDELQSGVSVLGNQAELQSRLAQVEAAIGYVESQRTAYGGPEYFRLNIDYGLTKEAAKGRQTVAENLLEYQQSKLTIERAAAQLNNPTARYVPVEQARLDQANAYMGSLSQDTVNQYETEIASRQLYAGVEDIINPSTGAVVDSVDQQTVRLLKQEAEIYQDYPDLAKYNSQLREWAKLLRDYAYHYGNESANITPEDLHRRLVNNENIDIIVASVISGQPVNQENLAKVQNEIEYRAGLGAVLTGRQGAPFYTSNPTDGQSINSLFKQAIEITETNRRGRELNTFLTSNETSASALMLVSAFGFEFTGLGDYDGDSFQAALSRVNNMTGEIAQRTVELRRLSREKEQIEAALVKARNMATPVPALVESLEEQLAEKAASIQQAENFKSVATQTIKAALGEVEATRTSKINRAYEGLRSYIGSFLALPEQVIGSKEIAENTVFKDEALRGLIKQFVDTLSGFNFDTGLMGGELGKYSHINAAEFDTDGRLQQGSLTWDEGFGKLSNEKQTRVRENFEYWSGQFEQSGSFYQAYLDKGSYTKDDYVQAVSEYQAQMESTVMSMMSVNKVFANVRGTVTDPENFGSMQAIMGITGGSLLGKVYNTVVPISSGLSADISFKRMLLDKDLTAGFNAAVERGFTGAIQQNADAAVGDALTRMQSMLTQEAVDNTTEEIIPWRIAMRETEERNAVSYRFLVTTQQYLRDAALKPKQAGGLSGRIESYRISESALDELKEIGITDREAISKEVGYTNILQMESRYTDHDQRKSFIQIVSQDFLGTVANSALQYQYGVDTRGPSVQETEGLTAFAALRLLTDYVSGKGDSAANLMENSSYGSTLKAIKASYQKALDDGTLPEHIKARVATYGRIDDAKLTTYVLSDMMNKFQANFISDAMLEGMKNIHIDVTRKALDIYGVNEQGQIVDDSKLTLASMESYIKDVQSYLDVKIGDSETEPVRFLDEIQNTLDDERLSTKQKVARIKGKGTLLLRDKYLNVDTADKIVAGLEARQQTELAKLREQQSAMSAAIQQELTAVQTPENPGAQLSEQTLTKAVIGSLVEHSISQQTDLMMPMMNRLKAFNRAVAEIQDSGGTTNLAKALVAHGDSFNSLAMEFSAQQYALDAGKLSGEALPKAFAHNVTAIVDAVKSQIAGGGSLSHQEVKGVFAALALGGAIPDSVQQMMSEAGANLTPDQMIDFQQKVVQALTYGGVETPTASPTAPVPEVNRLPVTAGMGALEYAAAANSYLHTQVGMAGLAQNMAQIITEKTGQITADTSEVELQQVEALVEQQKVVQQKLNENLDTYLENRQAAGFVSPLAEVTQARDNLMDVTQRSVDVQRAAKERAESHEVLSRMHGLAEGVSILGVPLLFSMMQGDIPLTEQVTSLGLDVVMSGITASSYERSSLRQLLSPSQDTQSADRTQRIADKLQFGRMQQYLMNYGSPTEGLARAAVSELIYAGGATFGTLLGQHFDQARPGFAGVPGVAGQTGAARLITEVAGGLIGMTVGGVISQRPIPTTTVTQDEFMADVAKSVSAGIQNIYNYLSQNLVGGDEEELDAEDLDSGETLTAMSGRSDIRSAFVDGSNVALSPAEFFQIISEDTNSPTTAQLLGIA